VCCSINVQQWKRQKQLSFNLVKLLHVFHLWFVKLAMKKLGLKKHTSMPCFNVCTCSFRRGCWKQALYASINCTREGCTCINSIKVNWCVRSMHMLLTVGIPWSMLIGTWNDVWDRGILPFTVPILWRYLIKHAYRVSYMKWCMIPWNLARNKVVNNNLCCQK